MLPRPNQRYFNSKEKMAKVMTIGTHSVHKMHRFSGIKTGIFGVNFTLQLPIFCCGQIYPLLPTWPKWRVRIFFG